MGEQQGHHEMNIKWEIGKSYDPETVFKYMNAMHRGGWEHTSYQDKEEILSHNHFVLKRVPLDDPSVKWYKGQHYPIAKKYSQLDTDMPPIVVNSEGYVLDGTHRISASELRGDDNILVLFGVKSIREHIQALLMEIATADFTIPKRIAKYYHISGSLRNVDQWEAQIILGNSLSDYKGLKIGDWEDIGYVMVSVDSNIIIPVSRSDEHQNGYELLYYFLEKGWIPDENYFPINPSGNNYVNPKAKEKAIIAFEKFRSYGGRNLPVQNTQTRDNMRVNIDTYIKLNGDVRYEKNKLADGGKQLLKMFIDTEQLYRQYRQKSEKGMRTDMIEKKIYKNLYAILNFCRKEWYYTDFNEDTIKNYEDRIIDFEGESKLQSAIVLIFGQYGLKKAIHNQLRDAFRRHNTNPDSFDQDYDRLQQFWGDIEYAIHELGGV